MRGLIGNFSQMYFGDIQCRLSNSLSDSQCQLLLCPVLKELISWGQNIKYADIYETQEQQVKVTNVFSSLLEIWELLLEFYRNTRTQNIFCYTDEFLKYSHDQPDVT